MTEDLSLVQINTQGLDSDLNQNFAALKNAVDTVSLNLTAFENATQSVINSKANDNSVVHLTGTETITGAKTFSSSSNIFQGDGSALTNLSPKNNHLNLASNIAIHMTTTQLLSAGVMTKINLNAKSLDSLGEYNTNTMRFIPSFNQTAMLQTNMATYNLANLQFRITKNGVDEWDYYTNNMGVGINIIYDFIAGSYYEFFISSSLANTLSQYTGIRIVTLGVL